MENYEKKYKELESKIKKAYLYAQTDSTKAVLEDILPELAMSEDNRIRKKLCKAIWTFIPHEEAQKYIAWLEKQESVEEIVERCKDSWYNEGKIAGMAEGLTDDEKYQQGWHDALEKQGEQNSAWNNGYSNGYIHAVEKAVEWLENHNDYIDVKDGNVTYFDMEKCVEDFGKYMRGVEE